MQDPYPLTQLYVKFRISAKEAIRQAYEYNGYKVTKEKIAEEADDYARFGNISAIVRTYATLILEGKIKI